RRIRSDVAAGSHWTEADSDAKLTLASRTPACRRNMRSRAFAQLVHHMPRTSSTVLSTVSDGMSGLVLRREFSRAGQWRRAITELGSLGLDDFSRQGRRLVAEARADIGCDGGDFRVGKLLAERRHEAVVGRALPRAR